MARSKTSDGQAIAPAHKSAWKLGGLTLWQLTKSVLRKCAEDDLFGRASGLAFNFLLALFPLIFFMLSLFGLFASRSLQLQNGLLSYFADFLPPVAFQLLSGITDELAASTSNGKLTFGILLAFWFGSGGVSSMISTLNLAYHVRDERSWVKVRVIALGLTLAISVLLFSALAVVLAGGHFVDWAGTVLHLGPGILIFSKKLQWPAAVLFVAVSFSLIYYFGPDLDKRRWRWATPGSVFGTFLWVVASAGFRSYLHFFNTYSRTYGSLDALMILLVWLYVSGLAFLIGGEIDAEIEQISAAESRT